MKYFSPIFLTFLISWINMFGQDLNPIKPGGYLSVEDFNRNSPTFDSCFLIEKRTRGSILAWGGNDYSVKCKNESVTDNIINKSVWGVFEHDTLYLNGHLIVGFKYYVKVEILGKYLFLEPVIPTNPKYRKKFGIKYDSFSGYTLDGHTPYRYGGHSVGGSPGGAIGGAAQGGQLALMKIPVLMEKESGQFFLATKESIAKLLDFDQITKNEFLNEKEINKEVIIKYLTIINKN
jgi:hypothetical protein